MKKELIIFDLDGTLVNSIPDLTDALNHSAKDIETLNFSETEVGAMVGGGVANLIEKAFNLNKTESAYKTFYDSFIEYYNENHSNRSYLYPDVLEILEHYNKFKLAVLSNKLERYTIAMCENFGMDKYLSLIMGANRDHEIKPSAEPILYMMKKLNIKPEDAVMIGDSEADVKCAKNAGITSIALTYGYRTRAQLDRVSPDYIIDDLSSLRSIIE